MQCTDLWGSTTAAGDKNRCSRWRSACLRNLDGGSFSARPVYPVKNIIYNFTTSYDRTDSFPDAITEYGDFHRPFALAFLCCWHRPVVDSLLMVPMRRQHSTVARLSWRHWPLDIARWIALASMGLACRSAQVHLANDGRALINVCNRGIAVCITDPPKAGIAWTDLCQRQQYWAVTITIRGLMTSRRRIDGRRRWLQRRYLKETPPPVGFQNDVQSSGTTTCARRLSAAHLLRLPGVA